MDYDSTMLRTYTGSEINMAGTFMVSVLYNKQRYQLHIYVVSGSGPNLLGRDFIQALNLPIPTINNVTTGDILTLPEILEKHNVLFKQGLGTLKDVKVALNTDPNAVPVVCKPRPVPYALREAVDAELQRLQDIGVLRPIKHSVWAAPLVQLIKSDMKSVRLCGDYRATINKHLVTDSYPLPKPEDIFATLQGDEAFTKLDLSEAYAQVQLDDESQLKAAINTQKGLFAITRLPYGVTTAPSIFQREMEILLRDIPGVAVYLDDILITAPTGEQHLQMLDLTLKRLESI
jgi:hypothetical protein